MTFVEPDQTTASTLSTQRTRRSQTALGAAAARAAHLIVDDEPYIFIDTLAATLLGEQADELIDYHRNYGSHVVLTGARTQVTCRSHVTEQCVVDGARRGITQYVILGAGLDSFAYRSELTGAVRVFEVDHPATQEWKRGRLSTADIPVPAGVTYVGVDFETDALAERLAAHGFDPNQPSIVSWLGVTMYLTEATIGQTLEVVGSFAPGTEIIADYMVPAELRDETGQAYVDLVAPTTAEQGEPWLTFLSPDAMSALLEDHGFSACKALWQRDVGGPAMWDRTDALRPAALSVIAHATVCARD
jgi:methyltransferase (TIGR00027 family)